MTRTILVVDDNEAARTLVSTTLRMFGFQVAEAETGYEALGIARGERPIDLLLTDIILGGLDGRQLAEQVMLIWPEMKVLFMSGYPRSTLGMAAQEDVFLQKPFQAAELKQKVAALLQ